MYFLPWWVLLACLAASAFATYLLLGRTQAGDSPWTLFPLTAVLAPVVLVGAAVVAIALSTLLSAPPEDRAAHESTQVPYTRTPNAARGYEDDPCRRHGPRDEYPVRVPERFAHRFADRFVLGLTVPLTRARAPCVCRRGVPILLLATIHPSA